MAAAYRTDEFRRSIMALGRLLGIDLEILEMGIRSKQEHLDGNLFRCWFVKS